MRVEDRHAQDRSCLEASLGVDFLVEARVSVSIGDVESLSGRCNVPGDPGIHRKPDLLGRADRKPDLLGRADRGRQFGFYIIGAPPPTMAQLRA